MRPTLLLISAVLASFTFADAASARTVTSARDGAPVTRQSRRSLLQEMRAKAAAQGESRRQSVTALPNAWLDESIGVGIRYADGWEKQQLNETEGALTLVVMFLSEARGGIRANVNLVLEQVDQAVTLDEYTRLAIANEEAFLPNFSLTEATRVPVAGRTAQRVRFTAGSPGAMLEFEQVWFLQGGVAHVWTFADSAETFDDNVGTFRHMLDSLRVR